MSSLGIKLAELLAFQARASPCFGLIHYKPHSRAWVFEAKLNLDPAQLILIVSQLRMHYVVYASPNLKVKV